MMNQERSPQAYQHWGKLNHWRGATLVDYALMPFITTTLFVVLIAVF
jgi:hypothetical protein